MVFLSRLNYEVAGVTKNFQPFFEDQLFLSFISDMKMRIIKIIGLQVNVIA